MKTKTRVNVVKTTTTYRKQILAALAAGFTEIYVPGIEHVFNRVTGFGMRSGWYPLRMLLDDGDAFGEPSPLDDVIEDPIELPCGGTVGLGRCVIGWDVYAASRGR